MKPLLAAFAILALAAPAVHAQDTETVTRTVTLDPGGTLDLKTFSGRVVITAVDEHQVTIHAVRRASRSALDRVRLDVTRSGSTVYVNANHHDYSWWRNNVVDTDLDVRVPRQTNLRINSFSAPVEVDGIDASAIDAHTFSGPVALRLGAWRRDERIDIKTFSGAIELRVPDNAAGHVDFNSFSGKLNSELPLTLHSTSHRNFSAELGSGGDGSVRIHTFSGGVKIHR